MPHVSEAALRPVHSRAVKYPLGPRLSLPPLALRRTNHGTDLARVERNPEGISTCLIPLIRKLRH